MVSVIFKIFVVFVRMVLIFWVCVGLLVIELIRRGVFSLNFRKWVVRLILLRCSFGRV